MGKLLKGGFIAALVAGSIGMVAVPAAQAVPTPCTGLIANTRIGGDVEVPGGQTCTLSNVIVGNRVVVDPTGRLVMLGTTVAGNLVATQPASIRIDSLGCAGTSCTTPSIVRGTATIDGTTSVPAGFTKNYVCNGTKFNGDSMSLKNSASTAPYDVGGSTCSFGGNSAFGVMRVTGNAGNVSFANNRAGDNIVVNTNTGGGSLVNNHSGGSILCSGNVPAYAASGNSAAFTNQSKLGTC